MRDKYERLCNTKGGAADSLGKMGKGIPGSGNHTGNSARKKPSCGWQ